MADTFDDMGDVEGAPKPPLHPEYIRKECQRLGDEFMEFMMEHMSEYADLDAKSFSLKAGRVIGFLLGAVSPADSGALDTGKIRELFDIFKRGFFTGVDDAQEAMEEDLEHIHD